MHMRRDVKLGSLKELLGLKLSQLGQVNLAVFFLCDLEEAAFSTLLKRMHWV